MFEDSPIRNGKTGSEWFLDEPVAPVEPHIMARKPEQVTRESTTSQSSVTGDTRTPHQPLPTLTVLYHADLQRIGERAVLSEFMRGRPVPISRLMPRFAHSNDQVGSPLHESHISRRPLFLYQQPDGSVELDASNTRTRVTADGRPVTSTIRFSHADMTRGVILELGAYVALLLHLHQHAHRRGESDLGLIGRSDAINAVREDIRRVASIDVPVLIRGETGSGKELVARAIHRCSARRDHPMVSVNLAALPASLAVSEMFGVVRGAFTGADRNHDGYFRRADRSTLFLDEIGEAPGDIQVMLLRALETGEVHSLGGSRSHRVDVRLLAATDADLEVMMAEGTFRPPLLHRLAGYEIVVPPLRARRDDIAPLLVHFLAKDLAEAGEPPRLHQPGAQPWLPMALVLRLVRYDWPGNVRELRNAARQLVIGNSGRPVAELPTGLARRLDAGPLAQRSRAIDLRPSGPPRATEPSPQSYRKPSEVTELELLECLREHRWDIKATAKALRLARTSVYGLIRESDQITTASALSAEVVEQCYRETDGDLDAMVDRLCVSRNGLRRRIRELGLA